MDILPTDLFPGYTANGTAITIPLAALPGLLEAEAAAADGDGRKVAYELIKAIHAGIAALPVAERPNRFIASTGGLSLVDENTMSRVYQQTVYLGIGDVDVATETTTTTTTGG